ncbi:MAG: glycosyltransferase family 2 protein [Planctomycetota bacterium]
MRTAVVIVNYRVASLTVEAVDALLTDGGFDGEIVVVDNLSPDDSVKVLGDAFTQPSRRDRCTLVPSDRNGGFAAGNNVGLKHLLGRDDPPDAFHLINPDTIAAIDATPALVRAAMSDSKVGIVGSRMKGPDGEWQASAFRFPNCMGEFERGAMTGPVSKALRSKLVPIDVGDDPVDADWVSGASFLVTREVIDRIGLMDEGFFLYYEEVELCWRAKQAGYRVRYEPGSVVVHLEGQSTTTADKRPVLKSAHWYNSRRRYFERTGGRARARLADASYLSGAALRAIRDVGSGGPKAWGELRGALSKATKHGAERGDG